MSDPTQPIPVPPGGPPPPENDRPWWIIGALVAAVVILAGALVFVLVRDDDDSDVTADTTTTVTDTSTTTEATTTEATTTTTAATTTSSTVPNDQELATAVWPGPETDTRYDDPTAAAKGFATELAGFTDPIVGDYMAGDSRSGEIEIRADAQGPVTLVFVRQLGDDSWWVLGAVTDNIKIEQPEASATIGNPVELSGQSRAFEAVVNVSVFALGDPAPLGEGTVMGSGGPDLGPFSGQIDYDQPSGSHGVVMLYTRTAKDGSVWEATAIPVQFR